MVVVAIVFEVIVGMVAIVIAIMMLLGVGVGGIVLGHPLH